MNNTSPVGWQAYPQNQAQPQFSYGQNGGNFGSQAMQQTQDPPFVGRFINQIEEVMPREVPMDGRIAVFPSQSLEEIFIKAWDRNGNIKTIRYILDPMQNLNQAPQQAPNMGAQILERLDQLEQRLNDTQSKPNNQRNKSKGGDDNA